MVSKHRRNFLPTFILNVLLWLSFLYVVFKIPPDFHSQLLITNYQLLIPLGYLYFFLTLSLSLTLTLAFLFSNTRRGFFLNLFICGFLLLRLIKQAHFLNLILLGGILICLELCFSRRNTPNQTSLRRLRY